MNSISEVMMNYEQTSVGVDLRNSFLVLFFCFSLGTLNKNQNNDKKKVGNLGKLQKFNIRHDNVSQVN